MAEMLMTLHEYVLVLISNVAYTATMHMWTWHILITGASLEQQF